MLFRCMFKTFQSKSEFQVFLNLDLILASFSPLFSSKFFFQPHISVSLPAVTDYVYILSSTSLLMLFYLPDSLPFPKPPSALQRSSISFNPTYWNSSSIFKVNSRLSSFTQSSIVTSTGSNLFPSEILQDLIYLWFSDKHLAHVYLMYTFPRHCLWQ